MSEKRKRGRPRKTLSMGELLASVFLTKETQKGGRPIKTILDEKVETIQRIDALKAEIGKPSLPDRKLLGFIATVRDDTRKLRSDKKNSVIERMLKELKYFRDETGMRQGKRSVKQ